MLSFSFLQSIKNEITTYQHFILPVVICDVKLKAYWRNEAAKNVQALSVALKELSLVFSELDPDKVVSRLRTQGSYLAGSLLPALDYRASLLPLQRDGEIIGVAAIFTRPSMVPDGSNLDYLSKTVPALTSGLREYLDQIFRAKDQVLLGADILGASWAVPPLNVIELNSYKILRLADNIASYTQLANNLVTLKYSAFDLSGWLSSAQLVLRQILGETGIELKLTLPDSPMVATLDTHWFQLAVFNIIHNSIYYTRANNVITIALEAEADCFKLVVSDRGIGMNKGVMDKLYTPYFSPEASPFHPDSLGLGLAVAKRIIQLHGGTLEISSRQGEGTTAVITAPLTSPTETIQLGSRGPETDLHDRFSLLYVGLTSALDSPHNGDS